MPPNWSNLMDVGNHDSSSFTSQTVSRWSVLSLSSNLFCIPLVGLAYLFQ